MQLIISGGGGGVVVAFDRCDTNTHKHFYHKIQTESRMGDDMVNRSYLMLQISLTVHPMLIR